jgi:putative redox protein
MVEAKLNWIHNIAFEVNVRGHYQFTDGKKEVGGGDRGPTPKEYVLAGLCGCSGMDVASLLKKMRVPFTKFSVRGETDQTKEHPAIFTEVHVHFELEGEGIDSAQFEKAVVLSMTKYCGVSAMLVKAVPIFYHLHLNGAEIKTGQANF